MIIQKTVVLRGKPELALVCVAIDFGTTFSGYAITFKSNPSSVMTSTWGGTEAKVPETLLLFLILKVTLIITLLLLLLLKVMGRIADIR